MYEKQMELFEDGGLRDEGGMVDEESGNEVPAGSTRKEVRDDIPAMLSEGEFVFPADVVRYIGLENLMRIRQEAKMGLKQMEAMGQMGNSDEATLPDDMPFSMMDLIIVEGKEEEEPEEKAHGGVIHAANGTFVTPMFDPSNQDVREYKNEAGDSLFIPFLGGEPVYPIPAGYFPAGQAPTKTETEQAIPTGSDDDQPPTPTPEGYDWNTDTSATDGKALAEWIKQAERQSTFGNVAAGIAMGINPLIGGVIALANKNQKKQIVEMLDEKIAQARKTPVQGQVAALQDLKKRLTTKEGQTILGKVVNAILDPITNALGLSEEEKKKSKAAAVVNASQDPKESDEETKKKQEAVDKTPDLVAEDLIKQGIMNAGDLAPPIPKEPSYDEVPTRLKTKADKFREEEERIAKQMNENLGGRLSSYDTVPTRAEMKDSSLLKEPTMPQDPYEQFVNKLEANFLATDGQSEDAIVKAKDQISKAIPTMPAEVETPTLTSPVSPSFENLITVAEDLRKFTSVPMKDEYNVPAESYLNKFTKGFSEVFSDKNKTPVPRVDVTPPTPRPTRSDNNDDSPLPTPTPKSTQTVEQKQQTQAATQKAKETLTSGQRAGSAELDKTYGISGLKSGGLASRKKKK